MDLVIPADGRLILEPGYHREARLFYSPTQDLRGIEIPDKPSPADVSAALSLIFDELLYDFPFHDQASKANALAVMLLPFVRLMITGPTKNHHFTSSTEGVGKGKCANACAFPFLGRKLDINPQKESEAEWRKALTSFLMSGASHYFIDNLTNPLGWDNVALDIDSGTLAAAWTGSRWKDRLLGGNDEAKVQIHAVFMSAGNNVAFSRELTRRLVNIEIVAVSEDPSLRTNFKHDPIEEWARDNRAALTRSCLTLCSNWIAQGRKPGNCTMGSYESYARTMGGVLDACGVGGFLDNRPKTGAARDRESIRWPALVSAWHKDRGGMATSAGMVYDLVFGDPGIPDLQIAFADLVGDGKPLSQKQRFGHAIGKQDGRVWAGHRVVRTGAKTADGVVLFRLVDPSEDEPDE
jgi:putative DNA primase/helicase